MEITGAKTDVWLVKTTSVLIIPISLWRLSTIYINSNFIPVAIVGLGSAIGLASIDFYYSLNNVISDVYMADGFIQIVFAIAWLYFIPGIVKNFR